MKKGRVIGISLLSVLIAFSLINTTIAAAPSYVGVSTGDNYTWVGAVDMTSVNGSATALFGAENWTLAYNMLNEIVENETGMGIGSFLAAGIKVTILNVSDEVMIMSPLTGSYVLYNVSFSTTPNVWSPPMPTGSVLLDPANMNSTNFMYFVLSELPLFISKGINYNNVATWATSSLATYPPIYSNITFAGASDGYVITIKGEYLEWGINQSLDGSTSPIPLPTFTDITVTVKYTANGILSYAALSFMGFTLLTLQLTSTGEIPGFEITVFLGVSAATIIGIIYVIRKKKFR